jgi:hypothetical protein
MFPQVRAWFSSGSANDRETQQPPLRPERDTPLGLSSRRPFALLLSFVFFPGLPFGLAQISPPTRSAMSIRTGAVMC